MMFKILILVIDRIIYIGICLPFVLWSLLVVLFGKNPARKESNRGSKKILRFCATNIPAIKQWNVESFLLSNLNSFFSKSILVCLPNTVYENCEYTTGDIRIVQISQHPDTRLKSAGFRKTNSILSEIDALSKIYRIVKEEEIDIILAQDPHFMGGNALIVSRLTGVPYMIHVITNYDIKDRLVRKLAFPPFMFLAIEKAVERFVFRNAAFVTSSYENYRDYALQNGADPRKTFALRTIINEVHFKDPLSKTDIKQELGINDKKMLLYVSRLAAVKFPIDVIRCFDIVLKNDNDAVLIIVGKGPLEDDMVALSRELGVSDKIKFIQSKSQDELSEMYRSSDVIIFPHAGITLVEAALSARPIVAYDYEWHPEVIGRDERGYLADFRNYTMLAEKVLHVLGSYDEALTKARKAREFTIENFSKDKILSLEQGVFERYFNGDM